MSRRTYRARCISVHLEPANRARGECFSYRFMDSNEDLMPLGAEIRNDSPTAFTVGGVYTLGQEGEEKTFPEHTRVIYGDWEVTDGE